MGIVSLPCIAAAVLALAGEGKGKKAGDPGPKADAPPKHKAADNGPCFVCHANYEEESMAVTHAKAGTGCMDCHGPSLDHRNDEANVTPPDVLYPAAKIDAACRKCHEDHNAPAVKVIAQWQERCPGKKNPSQIVCTDCHGEHRLKLRTVRWDKETRKLLE
jgi:formate-dependent nitrite reductase cytochrome c552 subunit